MNGDEAFVVGYRGEMAHAHSRSVERRLNVEILLQLATALLAVLIMSFLAPQISSNRLGWAPWRLSSPSRSRARCCRSFPRCSGNERSGAASSLPRRHPHPLRVGAGRPAPAAGRPEGGGRRRPLARPGAPRAARRGPHRAGGAGHGGPGALPGARPPPPLTPPASLPGQTRMPSGLLAERANRAPPCGVVGSGTVARGHGGPSGRTP